VSMMLAQVARAGVRRHLARASTTQLLSRPFAQVAEQVVDTSPSEKVLLVFHSSEGNSLRSHLMFRYSSGLLCPKPQRRFKD
jgi:hypothetical protein